MSVILPTFNRGHPLIGVCGAPYKCPVAPSECALMLHGFSAAARRARRLPKAGVFAEGAAKVALNLSAIIKGQAPTAQIPGYGTCYVEFGAEQIGRVDVDFFRGPKPTGTFREPSEEMRGDKQNFGATRRARWFGRTS